MGYSIKAIYAISSYSLDNYGATTWCSDPQKLITEIADREDVSGDGYVEEDNNTDPTMAFMRRKIVKKIGIYLEDDLVRICKTKDEANEVLKKFEAFEKKLKDMSVGEEIFLVDNDLYKFSEPEDESDVDDEYEDNDY